MYMYMYLYLWFLAYVKGTVYTYNDVCIGHVPVPVVPYIKGSSVYMYMCT